MWFRGPSPEKISEAIEKLTDISTVSRQASVVALRAAAQRHGSAKLLKISGVEAALVQALSHGDASVRCLAADMLSKSREPTSVAAIGEALKVERNKLVLTSLHDAVKHYASQGCLSDESLSEYQRVLATRAEERKRKPLTYENIPEDIKVKAAQIADEFRFNLSLHGVGFDAGRTSPWRIFLQLQSPADSNFQERLDAILAGTECFIEVRSIARG